MSCENVQERISLLLDRKLPARDRESMLAHIGACRACGTRFEMMQNQVAMVRGLNQPAIPRTRLPWYADWTSRPSRRNSRRG